MAAVIFLKLHDHCFHYTLVLSLVAFARRRRPLILVRGCYYVTAAAGSSQHRSATMSLVRGGDRPLLLGRRVQGGGTAAEKEDAGGT